MKTYNYVNGSSIKVSDTSSLINKYTWYEDRIFELEEIQTFSDLIKDENGFTVLDIGAQSGAFCLMANLYKKTKWIAYEPDLDNYNCLLENLEINEVTNVKTENIAVGNRTGKIILNVCTNHKGLNTIGENLIRFGKDNTEEREVNITTLDEYVKDDKVDLIKIDTEGAEYDIIIGAKKVIQKWKPMIFMEYCDENLRQFGRTIEDLNRLIEEIGYKINKEYSSRGNVLIQSK